MKKNTINLSLIKERTIFREFTPKEEGLKKKMSDPKSLKIFSGKDLNGLSPLDLPKFYKKGIL